MKRCRALSNYEALHCSASLKRLTRPWLTSTNIARCASSTALGTRCASRHNISVSRTRLATVSCIDDVWTAYTKDRVLDAVLKLCKNHRRASIKSELNTLIRHVEQKKMQYKTEKDTTDTYKDKERELPCFCWERHRLYILSYEHNAYSPGEVPSVVNPELTKTRPIGIPDVSPWRTPS